MSEISEKARAEADRVEAEEAELEQEEAEEAEAEEAEPEPAPEPPVVDEAVIAAQDRALTAEDKRHQTKLGQVFGQKWPEHARCALCDGIGFLDPELAAGFNTEQWNQVISAAINMTQRPLIQDTNYQRCKHCDGWGQTVSGAQDPEHYTKLCDVCSGNGFIQKVPSFGPPVAVGSANGEPQQPQYVIPSYGSPAANDQWDRPAGHPHYGIPPAAVVG